MLEADAYSDLSIDGVALITDRKYASSFKSCVAHDSDRIAAGSLERVDIVLKQRFSSN